MPADPDPDPYERTVARMRAKVARVREPRPMMAALRWSLDELERTYAATPKKILATVACRAGCDACCHLPVDVQAHEVFWTADHVQLHFPPDALEALVDRLAAHRELFESFGPGERDASIDPCALLDAEGACSIHEGRPAVCRVHHSHDAAACAAHVADRSVDIASAYIPHLRARMFSVMLGIDEALESSGFDKRAYDFNSALHEALTNSLCLAAWLRQEPAFPDSCLADREG